MVQNDRGTGPKWVDLLDPEYLESGCAAVRDAVAERSLGNADAMSQTLRARLIDLLDAYVADHLPPESPAASSVIVKDGKRRQPRAPKMTATQATLATAWQDADRKGFGRGRPVHVEAARALAAQAGLIATWLESPVFELAPQDAYTALRERWRDFIIAGAAHLVYYGVPKNRAQQSDAGSQRRGRARDVTPEDVTSLIGKLELKVGRTKAIERTARELVIGESTVRKRLDGK